jgi:nitroreductase
MVAFAPEKPSMYDPAQAFAELMSRHRSIRSYADKPIDAALLDDVLVQALAGSSSSGNLNMVSVIRTRDVERKRVLFDLHGQQPMVLQAPLVLTFCADSHRTRLWLAQRQARPGFADLNSWHVAAFDAIILAQTTALALQSHGLGICYMGTTLFAMRKLAKFFEMPQHVLPVTSMVVGWPAEAPAQRDRLPATAWVHDERYHDPTPADIDAHFGQREVRGWQRYRSMGQAMIDRMAEHGITSLAQYYTSKIKYDPDLLGEFSADMRALLIEHGFLDETP